MKEEMAENKKLNEEDFLIEKVKKVA